MSGFARDGFEGVAAAFESNFHERGELGAAFAATWGGRPVVDLWGGIADARTGAPWREGTLQAIFSGAKGLLAVCLLILIERGAIDLDAPVARYWPEFAEAGKSATTLRHLVSHRAGLPGLRNHVAVEDILDGRRMARLLARQEPFWPAGTVLCYHPLTFGWLCAELIRRVDGRAVGVFFAEEIARPLGLEIWIGLPKELETRVSVLQRKGGTDPGPSVNSHAWAIAYNPPLWHGEPTAWNSRAFHAAEIPGAGAIGTARSLARLFGCLALGGEIDGVRLLEPETIALGTTCLVHGRDACFDWPLAFGVAFALQTDRREFGPPPGGFGHSGAGGSVHGSWPIEGVGFSYVMNDMRWDDTTRSDAILHALFEAVSQPRGRTRGRRSPALPDDEGLHLPTQRQP